MSPGKLIDFVHDNAYRVCMTTKPVKQQSEAARSHRIVQGICAECGKPFEGYKIRRYHSRACQVRAYRRRKREAERQRRLQ